MGTKTLCIGGVCRACLALIRISRFIRSLVVSERGSLLRGKTPKTLSIGIGCQAWTLGSVLQSLGISTRIAETANPLLAPKGIQCLLSSGLIQLFDELIINDVRG